MKHLERAKRLLKLKETAAENFRGFEEMWRRLAPKHSSFSVVKDRAEQNRRYAEDAEFEAELLREYIAKWEKEG